MPECDPRKRTSRVRKTGPSITIEQNNGRASHQPVGDE